MNDIELTRLCAEAMGFDNVRIGHGSMGTAYVTHGRIGNLHSEFRPLHDDAQAMALVKRFGLGCTQTHRANEPQDWCVTANDGYIYVATDLNRAICECVAKMAEQGKGGE